MVARHTKAPNCQHLEQLGSHINEDLSQTLSFQLEGINDQDTWNLRYMTAQYMPHLDLSQLIRNHENAEKYVSYTPSNTDGADYQ